MTGSYLAAHTARVAQPLGTGLNAHTPAPRDLAESFALEEMRQLGNDWVVRYHNRALQVTPTRAAQRHVAPGRRVLVRETEAGVVRIIVRDPATAREYELAWTPLVVTARTGRFTPPAAVQPAPVQAAGYTRAGKPLSAKQMAVRTRWNNQAAAEI